MQNFSFPVQFYWITRFCSKYFVRDCRYEILPQIDNFDILDQIFRKKVFSLENGKSEQHH